VFIDPYFGPDNPRHRRPLQAFLRALIQNRKTPIRSIEYITSTKILDFGYFKSECEKLSDIIPRNIAVTVIRLRQKMDGEKLHNRYILTDIGGVKFNTGLDDGKSGETDDVDLLDRIQLNLRWQQYCCNPRAFDIVDEPVTVVGRAPIGKPR
jgi:hypothetical protein